MFDQPNIVPEANGLHKQSKLTPWRIHLSISINLITSSMSELTYQIFSTEIEISSVPEVYNTSAFIRGVPQPTLLKSLLPFTFNNRF